MIRDYQIASPSLEGVLRHDSIVYEGIERPMAILRFLDGPAAKGRSKENEVGAQRGGPAEANMEEGAKNGTLSEKDFKVLQEYFYDLYGLFMKKLSFFLTDNDVSSDDSVKLQAMLQEMIRIKKWVVR